jgi:hypothetical protein
MKLDARIVAKLAVPFLPRNYLRVLPRRHARNPLGMGYGETRFASIDRSFQLIYVARNLATGLAETIIRDRFEDKAERTLHISEAEDWVVSRISTAAPLILVDLRTTGLLELGVTTDAARAKSQEAGRRLSQSLYENFAIDGVLYLSRLTGAECAAVYDRAASTKLKASKAVGASRLRAFPPALASMNVRLLRSDPS